MRFICFTLSVEKWTAWSRLVRSTESLTFFIARNSSHSNVEGQIQDIARVRGSGTNDDVRHPNMQGSVWPVEVIESSPE